MAQWAGARPFACSQTPVRPGARSPTNKLAGASLSKASRSQQSRLAAGEACPTPSDKAPTVWVSQPAEDSRPVTRTNYRGFLILDTIIPHGKAGLRGTERREAGTAHGAIAVLSSTYCRKCPFDGASKFPCFFSRTGLILTYRRFYRGSKM